MTTTSSSKLPLLGLDGIILKKGSHTDRERGVCAMEAVAWLAGLPHSDQPKCTSSMLGQFMRSWNDALDDEDRQKLKPYLPRLIGTAGDGHDEERAWLCTDWLARVCAPAWLELAGMKDAPAALRKLKPIIDAKAAANAQSQLNKARDSARASWDAARAVVWDAARAAAGDAAGAAAGDAAGAAAGDAARAAARAAAGAAAGDAAGAAAWDTARAAAGAAAGAAVWDAARAAARDAAQNKLQPTVISLQASALDLLEQMLVLGEPR